MKDVLESISAIALFGLVSLGISYWIASDELNAAILDDLKTYQVSHFVYSDAQKRSRGSGPEIYVYEALNAKVLIKSLVELEPNLTISCYQYTNVCFNSDLGGPLRYKSKSTMSGLYIGPVMLLLAFIMWVYRNKLAVLKEARGNGT
ncbi:hypothetical protein QTP81_11510 [Alteromonas sp. ASW11-36]|uniref:DUF3592 domain-containing protein n=1 Tax=Alteromonas arenosi TaxID=3055817 RepID=A0ABT7SYE7_9ALTE|nr:hypothetical protein [Alteromonas sp. ASW11-36]MDM7861221.1 hypothetical protein [Alteromonas sp. ASW11-36]